MTFPDDDLIRLVADEIKWPLYEILSRPVEGTYRARFYGPSLSHGWRDDGGVVSVPLTLEVIRFTDGTKFFQILVGGVMISSANNLEEAICSAKKCLAEWVEKAFPE